MCPVWCCFSSLSTGTLISTQMSRSRKPSKMLFQFPIDWDAHFDRITRPLTIRTAAFQFPIDWDAHFDVRRRGRLHPEHRRVSVPYRLGRSFRRTLLGRRNSGTLVSVPYRLGRSFRRPGQTITSPLPGTSYVSVPYRLGRSFRLRRLSTRLFHPRFSSLSTGTLISTVSPSPNRYGWRLFQFPIDWDAHFDASRSTPMFALFRSFSSLSTGTLISTRRVAGAANPILSFQFPIDWDAHFDAR